MASKRAVRRRSCGRKVRHRDQTAAIAAARALRRDRGESVLPYACGFCGAYHVGHPPAKVRQAIAAGREG